MKEHRKLAAIMFTDIVGYTAMMSRDENLALQILDTNRKLHKDRISNYNGDYIKEIGDGTLAVFPSAWDAVSCALDLQKSILPDGAYRLRIGIHIGDVVTEGMDVFGDGVNIAARIQSICEPGKIFISGRVLEDVKNKIKTEVDYVGERTLKNIDHPVEIYALSVKGKGFSAEGSSGDIRKRGRSVYARKDRMAKITRLVLFLMAGLLIAAVLYILFRPTLTQIFNPHGSTPIAVISFENQTGDTSFNYLQKAIPNLLITNLEQSSLFQVITWERMHDVIRQLGRKDVEVIDAGLGFDVCRKEECAFIVIGSFVKAGEIFATDAKVLDVETKKIINSVSARGNSVGSILENQIDELSKGISRSIGISARKIKTARLRIRDVTTNSMDAYNYFLKGREACEKLYLKDARQYLAKAVKIDPGFAMAYFYLSITYDFLDDIQNSNDALGKAYFASARATENEQLLIRARYMGRIQQDKQQQHDLLVQLAEKAPRDKRAFYLLVS